MFIFGTWEPPFQLTLPGNLPPYNECLSGNYNLNESFMLVCNFRFCHDTLYKFDQLRIGSIVKLFTTPIVVVIKNSCYF